MSAYSSRCRWERGAAEQVAALAARAVPLDNPLGVAVLLDSLRRAGGRAGAAEQVTALINRLLEGCLFEPFHEQADRQDRFRLGRQADGGPAEPWGWADLVVLGPA